MFLLLFCCLIYYLFGGIAISIGYHRYLTHNSFKVKRWFAYLIITMGLPVGTPIQWVGNHRFHHLYTDEELDPHSPLIRGFWAAHNGWIIGTNNPFICLLYAIAGPVRMLIDSVNRTRTNQQFNYLAKDVEKISFYRIISNPLIYCIMLILHATIPLLFFYSLWGNIGIITFWITLVIIYNLGDSIDSLAHLFGKKVKGSSSNARNNQLLAFFTFGEGLHANHHEHPSYAYLDLNKNSIDLGGIIIKILEKTSLIYDINAPKA